MPDFHHQRVIIEWPRLLAEFRNYQADAAILAWDSKAFVESLVEPRPVFVEAFLRQQTINGMPPVDRIKALYGYLLQKRYDERLNLLYFAFHIFDEETRLPQEIVQQTPLPHEDGVPSFRHFGEPDFSLDPVVN
ncbi:MAG TPA: hypothetical protein DCZ69_16890 [Syntrophobacteraceae bacterium]|jgi:hypothetical protein|nr:hypothetical protein [Syntrophobacteraceae bacterium]HBZ55894.1 hypothetical protein [Syntrophobacteraceae bacterium]